MQKSLGTAVDGSLVSLFFKDSLEKKEQRVTLDLIVGAGCEMDGCGEFGSRVYFNKPQGFFCKVANFLKDLRRPSLNPTDRICGRCG